MSMEKNKTIENLSNQVTQLGNKVVEFEERIIDRADITSKTDEPEDCLEKTFANPSSVIKCKLCDFRARSDDGLDTHVISVHEEPEEEMKIQLFAIVEREFRGVDVRNAIVENLKKHKEIEKVITVFVDSRCRTFFDIDGKLFTQADIKFTSKFKKMFENQIFRNSLFDECNLRETIPIKGQRMNRAEYLNHRNETGWR